jgi:hypothetical protein
MRACRHIRYVRLRRLLAVGSSLAICAVAVGGSAVAMTNGWRVRPANPWNALIISNVGGLLEEPVCSGTVVGDGWILTAAHCVTTKQGTTLNPRNLRVLVGRDDRGATDQGAAYGIARIVPMPGFVSTVKDDAALIQVQAFDSTRWHAMPLAFESFVVNQSAAVTFFGYGDTGWNVLGGSVGAGRLWKSPDGAFVRRPSCDSTGMICFSRTSSTKIMHGDSGGSWLRWTSGAWQLIGVEDVVQGLTSKGPADPAGATGPFQTGSDGRTLLQWVRDTASLPVPAIGTIVRDSATGNAWMVMPNGYRNWIPTGGDYTCFTGQGHPVSNMKQILIDSIADQVGVHAVCTPTPTPPPPPPPPPPSTYSETESIHHPVNTFTNYDNASGMGPQIAAGETVQVSCRVYDPTIVSVNPDGYWYRIASAPWNNAYYSPANTFLNGDPPDGPYFNNTDFAVPVC